MVYWAHVFISSPYNSYWNCRKFSLKQEGKYITIWKIRKLWVEQKETQFFRFVKNFSKKGISINMIDWETRQVSVHSWENCCIDGSSCFQWGPNGTLNSMSSNIGRDHCAVFKAIGTFIIMYYTSDLSVNPTTSSCQICTDCSQLTPLTAVIIISSELFILCFSSVQNPPMALHRTQWKPKSSQ